MRGDNSVAYPHGDRNKGRPARMASLREPTCTVSTLKIVHVGIFWKPMHTDGQSEGSCTCMDSSGSMCVVSLSGHAHGDKTKGLGSRLVLGGLSAQSV